MASAAPHVKLLRQLATAKDDYVSGALDIAWDGGLATIFVVFGQPSHALVSAGGCTITGQEAVDSLPRMLPETFEVSGWRRTMSPEETLACSIDELAASFVEVAGGAPEVSEPEEHTDSWHTGFDDSPDLGFTRDDFPTLPDGTLSHEPASPLEIRLLEILPTLTASLVTLTGPRLHAAGVVVTGELIDAVWMDGDDHACGDTAVIALRSAREGTMRVAALPGPLVAEALPMLWRLPRQSTIDSVWLDPASLIAALQGDEHDRAVIIDGPQRGAALFRRGDLVCVYNDSERTARADPDLLRHLLSQGAGQVHVLQRPGTPATTRPAAPTLSATEGGDEPAATSESQIGVDFNEVKRELAALAVTRLGAPGAEQMVQLIDSTVPSVDDFIALIDRVRSTEIAGAEPTVVQALAHEMHQHAADRLCGA